MCRGTYPANRDKLAPELFGKARRSRSSQKIYSVSQLLSVLIEALAWRPPFEVYGWSLGLAFVRKTLRR